MGYFDMLTGSQPGFGRGMKEQYVGDISDYRKYALLRALSAGGEVRIGVCWMLTPPDGSSDGNKLAHPLRNCTWRRICSVEVPMLSSAVI